MPYKDQAARRAHSARYVADPAVAARRKIYQKRWAIENRDHLLDRERRRRLEKRAQCLIAHARIRARRKKLLFDLDEHESSIQARIDAGFCELTGYPFDLRGGQRQFASPSLDRINPALGYVIGNVRVICFAMNSALGNWGEAAFAEIALAWIVKRASP